MVPGPSRDGPNSPEVSARCAVTAGTPSDAPRSNDAPSGSGTTCAARCTVYSAAVPWARSRWASTSQTRSPTASPSTPSPTASTTPGAVLARA